MEEIKKPLLIALSEAVALNFPELGGRAIAVSEVDPFDGKTNLPTLPIAFSALVAENATQSANGGGAIDITSDILLTFIFEPKRYQRQDGLDSPFFAFYNYEALRDRFLEMAVNWESPGGGKISYRSLDVESDPYGIWISLRFSIRERWCRPKGELPLPMVFSIKLEVPSGCPEECRPSQPLVKEP
ncbi:MAG: hypothetical protein ACRCYS_07845 [Beijerinckiaceae bacterium]